MAKKKQNQKQKNTTESNAIKKTCKKIAKLFAKKTQNPFQIKKHLQKTQKILQKQTNTKHLATKKHKKPLQKKPGKKTQTPLNKPTLYPL